MPQSDGPGGKPKRDGQPARSKNEESTASSLTDVPDHQGPADDALSDAEWKRKQSRHIYHLRAQTGLTQEEFAALLGWSTSKQSQIEQNTDAVRIRPLDVMAARFIAMHPLEALKLSRRLPSRTRAKIVSYAERLEDFDVP